MGKPDIPDRPHCITPNKHRRCGYSVAYVIELPRRQLASIKELRPNVWAGKVDLEMRVLMRQPREGEPVGFKVSPELEKIIDYREGRYAW